MSSIKGSLSPLPLGQAIVEQRLGLAVVGRDRYQPFGIGHRLRPVAAVARHRRERPKYRAIARKALVRLLEHRDPLSGGAERVRPYAVDVA